MDLELRDYTTTSGDLDDWIRVWRHGVMPIRERSGFRLIGAWPDLG